MGQRGSKSTATSQLLFICEGGIAKPIEMCEKQDELSPPATGATNEDSPPAAGATRTTDPKSWQVGKRNGDRGGPENQEFVFVEDPIGGVWMNPKDIA